MTSYTVYFKETIYSSITVDAETLKEAILEASYEGLPGVMHLDHRYPDEDGWQIDEGVMYDEYGNDFDAAMYEIEVGVK